MTSAWKRPWCATLGTEQIGDTVELVGWVRRRRDLGGLVFVDLRDRSGLVQLVFEDEMVAEGEKLSGEDVIRVVGGVRARAEGQTNADLRSGEIEVKVIELELLTESETPPFVVEDEANASEELRLKYRYLDLRLLVPSRLHKGSFYALPQSPQLFKQLLQVAGVGRYVQIARCFHDEDLRADRQPEFSQIDVEASFITEEDIYQLVEGLFKRIFPIVGIEPPENYPRLAYADALERFGSDRPDTRFDLELIEMAPFCEGCGFRILETAAAEGRVKGIVVPGGAALSRKQLDALSDFVKPYGVPGVLWFKRTPDGVASPAKKALGEDGVLRFLSSAGAAEEDLLVVVGGREKVVFAALGALRLHLASGRGLIPEGRHDFLWVTDFPLLEWDEDEDRFFAMHHPFTSPLPEDVGLLASDPDAVRARAYDDIMDGVELGGGSIRINNASVQQQMFSALGINEEEARDRFGFLLEAFRFGVPPHGGIALGLDRMIMLMSGRDSIRDVIAFPKTTSASCLMTEAPSGVDAAQLEELGLKTR